MKLSDYIIHTAQPNPERRVNFSAITLLLRFRAECIRKKNSAFELRNQRPTKAAWTEEQQTAATFETLAMLANEEHTRAVLQSTKEQINPWAVPMETKQMIDRVSELMAKMTDYPQLMTEVIEPWLAATSQGRVWEFWKAQMTALGPKLGLEPE